MISSNIKNRIRMQEKSGIREERGKKELWEGRENSLCNSLNYTSIKTKVDMWDLIWWWLVVLF